MQTVRQAQVNLDRARTHFQGLALVAQRLRERLGNRHDPELESRLREAEAAAQKANTAYDRAIYQRRNAEHSRRYAERSTSR